MTSKGSELVGSDDDILVPFIAGQTYDVFFIGNGAFFNWEGDKNHRNVGEYITAASKVYDFNTNVSAGNGFSISFVFTCV